jgi:hypothetical protein
MFDHIFENRDKKVTNIIKLSDYLGRSLRENVEVFAIDDTDNKVTFVTEGGKIIAGEYDFEDKISLNNIQIEESDLFDNDDTFNEYVNYKISNFIEDIFEGDFGDADTSFSKVLKLWENRVKFSNVKEKLYEKSQKFNGSNRIIESEQFQKLVEVAPQLVKFLHENKNLVDIPEIKNMVKLSSAVSKAFDLPRVNYDMLAEESYIIPEKVNHTIYEMICKQELVRKELVESKNNFDMVWLNNDKISQLAGLINEQDEGFVVKTLVEAVCEVPYLALASKKQITETLANNLELNDTIKLSQKEIKAFSSRLFEYKKPIKQLFVSMLNEKYGISVQNLKDIPTFRSLLNTQVLIFEALAKLSPKGTVLKDVLTETSQMLKNKNGVESIDVNQFVELLFEKAGYSDILDEETLIEAVSLKETFSEIDSIEELVEMILERTAAKPDFLDMDGDGNKTETMKKAIKDKKKRKPAKPEPQEDEVELEDEPRVDESEPVVAEEEEAVVAEEEPAVAEEEPEEKKDKEVPTSNEIMASFKNFEDILDSIDFESLESEEEQEEAEAEEAEVDKEEEEGEE